MQTPAPSQVGWRYRRCRRRKPGRPVRTHVGEQQSPAIVFAVIALLGRIEVRDDRLRTALQRDEQVKRIALLLPAGPHARREAAPILLTAQASGTRAGAQSRQPCEVVSMKGCPPPRYGSQRTGLPGDARRDARLRHDSRAYAAGVETVLGGGGKRGPETELADDALVMEIRAALAAWSVPRRVASHGARLLPRRESTEECFERVGVDGLDEVVVEPDCEGALLVLLAPVAGQRDQGDGRETELLAHPARDLVPVDSREPDVEEDDVEPVSARGLERREPVMHDPDVVSEQVEDHAEAIGHIDVVLHHEHTCPAGENGVGRRSWLVPGGRQSPYLRTLRGVGE